MKIKKIKANSEKEAIEKVKKELGLNALILNIKQVQSKGFLGFLKKPIIQITAAYDIKQDEDEIKSKLKENKQKEDKEQNREENVKSIDIDKNKDVIEQALKDSKIISQQEKIDNLENMLSVMSTRLKASEYSTGNLRIYDNSILQIFYEALTAQGVFDYIARDILDDVLASIDDIENINISLVSEKVYVKIIDILGKPQPILKNENDTKFIFFIGPTGVGKTTTIAKLASTLILEENYNVGLVTADTYRIAAVEQLKVYAEILDIDIDVVYGKQDFIQSISVMQKDKDIVFIDTAGRSHKSANNLIELQELMNCIENSQKFLVLSITTKYEDLINIINTFSDVTHVDLIVTKFDETTCYGSIFNICYTVGKKISYITNGQNVPDDIELMQPEKMAKSLLGLEVDL